MKTHLYVNIVVKKHGTNMIEKLSKIHGVDIYYNEYEEDNRFLFGRKGDSDIHFVMGNTKDLKLYEKAIINYYNIK